MREITTIGLDLAKNVFQVHGVDRSDTVVARKRLPDEGVAAGDELGESSAAT